MKKQKERELGHTWPEHIHRMQMIHERNIDIIETYARQDKKNMAAIARRVGITRERVRQILKRYSNEA